MARWPRLALALLAVTLAAATAQPVARTMADDWANPPLTARLRAYWWWINGNVTKEAITRDLEEMKAKGFGGALICDADGSAQDGNDRAPHGPTFFSPEWRELYRHTLREADRLGLEMSLNIQSGWNLGGPMVKPDDAPKKLVWSEARVSGGGRRTEPLPRPAARDGFYRDLCVLAWPDGRPAPSAPTATLSASSAQPAHPVALAADGDTETYWVSGSAEPGGGPSADRPQSVTVEFAEPQTLTRVVVVGRPGYGPRECELLLAEDGRDFKRLREFTARPQGETEITFDAARARAVRVVAKGSYDPLHPASPRNVQIAELRLSGPAWSWPDASEAARRPLRNLAQKALLRPLTPSSAPLSAPLFEEIDARPDEQDAKVDAVLDLSARLGADGRLDWSAPAGGAWTVLRLGYTLNDHCRVSTCSQGWEGYALDPFDAGAFGRYWDAVVEPLIVDAGPLAGKSLRYLHTDSWEVEVANWTPTLRAEFATRRGYDLLPWLPVIAGKIVNSRAESNAFLHDFRRTMGDLAIANHYEPFRERARRWGLLIHPESGGPHAVPIDAQQCLGLNDAPMSEFWAWSWRHRVGDDNRFFVKQPASAAHTNGRPLVLAEGFTTIGPHWQETLWDNLKPSFDKALCEGLNLLVWHAFVCSPAEQGVPGQQYFAGTHLNPNVTWWSRSAPFFAYINRCQALLQRGRPVADVLYYYGDHVPNFAQLKTSDPAKALPGYDYDVISAEALLTRVSWRDGRFVLPDGVSYRLLALPERTVISLPVLRRLREWVAAGAAVIGPRPLTASGLKDSTEGSAELARLTDELWGAGKVIAGQTARAALLARGVGPDVEFDAPAAQVAALDFIHRQDGDEDIYFVANRATDPAAVRATFRQTGRAVELWDAISGERRAAPGCVERDGRTAVPLDLPPCGSAFVVFRPRSAAPPAPEPPRWTPLLEVGGPWRVSFEPRWGGPAEPVVFDTLTDWTQRPEPGIKHYSGTATYRRTLALPTPTAANPKPRLALDLGQVRELAEVRVNGQSVGIVWAPPFRVDITAAARPGDNELEVQVVNFWYNRVFADKDLPAEQRLTRTNIKRLVNPGTPLMPAGLLGPVRVLAGE